MNDQSSKEDMSEDDKTNAGEAETNGEQAKNRPAAAPSAAAEPAAEDMLSMSVRRFVAATAARTPTPGGGSVAGVVAALAAALGEMALNFTRGKKKFAAHQAVHQRMARRLARAREMAQQLVSDDAAAFESYQQAARMADSPEKQQAMQLATAVAIDVPRQLAKLAVAVLGDLHELADKCSKWLISDLLAAAALAEAACRLSDYNVRINLRGVADQAAAEDIRRASAEDVRRAGDLREQVERTAAEELP
ncbi:MAG: cyclodeaminase/cyclohydrolase family protein [Planctomycetes bacterium]|nr:cyclodeaminase/cyclohydrolase family protein [Planctomycetota bacterium]